MNHRFFSLLFAGAALLTACSQDDNNTRQPAAATEAAPAAPAAADSAPTPAPAASVAAPSSAAAAPVAKTMYQLLQGKWQSTTDEKAVIQFKNHDYIDYYDQEQLGRKPFLLDKACPGASGAGAPGDNEQYLVVPADDMCWYIAALDDVSLELEYIAGGKILVYSKMK